MTVEEKIERITKDDRDGQVARLEALIVRIKAQERLDECGGLDLDALSDAIGNLEDVVSTPYR